MKTNIKMDAVKLDAGFDGNKFFMTFRQGAEKGEKFDREKSEVYHTEFFELSDLPASLFVDCPASRHGLKQKMADNLAMTKELKAATTISTAVDSSKELWKQLAGGNWNTVAKSAKAPAITLTAMEAKFMAGVISGVTSWEAANELYKSITGKELAAVPED
jgi:hypothetical protein